MKKEMIAIIDDEKDLIETYAEILSEKYDVMTFSSPQELYKYLDSFQESPFKVMISDYNLGGKTGLDMIKELQEKKMSAPFILMSGYLDKSAVMKAHDIGAHRILEKPVQIEHLELAVDELIIEGHIQKVRKEMKEVTLQLKEVSSYFDIILSQYAPEDEINKFFMSLTSADQHTKFSSFRDFVENIEKKIYVLLKSEELLQKQLAQNQKSQHVSLKAA